MWKNRRTQPRRKYGKGLRRPKRYYRRGNTQVFSEFCHIGAITAPLNSQSGGQQIGTGGVYTVQFGDIPQWTNYQQLYNQYKILSVQWTFMPRYTQYSTNDQNQPLGDYRIANGRLMYAIQDTPTMQTINVETDVLKMNGVKIRDLTKPIVITHRPKPLLQLGAGVNNGSVSAQIGNNTQTFISFDGQSGHPELVPHAGVAFWIVVNGDGPEPPDDLLTFYDVYAKIRFVCRDPR